MLFSEKCADPDEKSYYACGNSSRPSASFRRNRIALAKVVVSYVIYPTSKYSNVFVLTLCMLSSFCPEHFNLTDLSPSGPARRFAEPDLGLNFLFDQSQTFSF